MKYTKGSAVGPDGYTIARSVHVAGGGSLCRRYRRNVSAARDIARKRRHGVPGSTGGLRMRPPGSGIVDYTGELRVRAALATGVDPLTAALAGLE